MKAAIYTRVSTLHQIDKDSLPFQREELKNYSKYVLGIDSSVVFEDAGYSGKNTDRPQYQDMMKRIRDGEFTHLLVYKIDRISRNLLDFCEIYDELKKFKVTFVSKNEQFDTSSAMGETMLKIILVFAELERKLTAERVTAVMLSRAEHGLQNAKAPFGYKWVDDKLVISDESYKIKLIFDLYSQLKSISLVIYELRNRNITSSRGGVFCTKVISQIIKNPTYKGVYRYNYRDENSNVKNESEWIIIENHHDPIVDDDLWQQCNDIITKNATKNSAHFRHKTLPHILGSILKCDKCGSHLISSRSTERKSGYIPTRYVCNNKSHKKLCDAKDPRGRIIEPLVLQFAINLINAVNSIDENNTLSELNDILTKNMFMKVDNLSLIDTHAAIIYNKNSSNKILATKLQPTYNRVTSKSELNAEKEKYTRALKRLQNLFLFDDDTISEKDYVLRKSEFEKKIIDIDSKLNEVEDILDISSVVNNSDSEFVNYIFNSNNLDIVDIDLKFGKKKVKDFINNIFNEIYVNDEVITCIRAKNGITYNFSKS